MLERRRAAAHPARPALRAVSTSSIGQQRKTAPERATPTPIRPVYVALLTRQGLTKDVRDEALAALVKLDRAPAPAILLDALSRVRPEDAQIGDQLIALLMAQPRASLEAQRAAFMNVIAESAAPLVRRGAYGALMVADGSPDAAWAVAVARPGHAADAMPARRGAADARRFDYSRGGDEGTDEAHAPPPFARSPACPTARAAGGRARGAGDGRLTLAQRAPARRAPSLRRRCHAARDKLAGALPMRRDWRLRRLRALGVSSPAISSGLRREMVHGRAAPWRFC